MRVAIFLLVSAVALIQGERVLLNKYGCPVSRQNEVLCNCNCYPEEAPNICSSNNSAGIHVAHENCNQFYICSEGRPATFSCPSNLLYNPVTEQCDWPENVQCVDRVTPGPASEEEGNGNTNSDEVDESSSSTKESEEGGNGGTCNCNPGEASTICGVEGSNGVLVAHEKCNKYYICVNGETVQRSCPSGLLYNPFKEVCDWLDNVNCGDRVIPEPKSEEDSNENDNGNTDTDNGNGESEEDGNGGTCHCNPGEAPALCGADESNGVLVAHEKCNKYYICVNGETVQRTCPSGLLYNPFKEVCDWPDNVNCGDRVIPEPKSKEDSNENDNGNTDTDNGNGKSEEDGNGGTCNCNPGEAPALCGADESNGVLVAHEKCNKYYICVNGETVQRTCPSGLLYNPFKEVCDWPDNVNCGDRVIPEPKSKEDSNENDNGNTDTDNGNGESEEDGNGGTCNCNPGEAPTICGVEGSNGVLVAHEKCNKYYICVNGETVQRSCPSGLLYNPWKEVCDWPDNVKCGDRVIPEPKSKEDSNENNNGNTDTDNGNGESEEDGNGGTCNCNPGEASALCAAEGSNGVLVAHEKCNKYYICVNGETVQRSCPSGLLYNPFKEVCDWPDNVKCGDRVIPEPKSEEDSNENDNGNTDTDNGNGESEEDGNGGTCNCNPGEAPALCAADESNGVLVAHEKCNKYYICVNGKTVQRTCPSGLLYNPFKEVCDWPDNVKCGDRVIPEPKSEEDSNENNNGNTDTDNGNGESEEDGNGGTCNCNPGEASALCAAEGSNGVLVAHEKCNKYYICVNGETVQRSCPSGLLYNPWKEVCDWPDNVKCGDRVIPEPKSKEDSNENNNGNTDTDNGNGESEEDGNGGTCNCNPGEASALCAAEGSNGVLVAHEKCNKYYICVNGETVQRSCPSGLLYNPFKEVCDWPDNVKCGDRVIPEPKSEEDSNENDNGNTDTDNGNGESEEDGNGGTCNCNPGEAPALCAADESNGVLVAHEKCNKYYICVNGKTVQRTCPSGLLYNPFKEVCDWPDNVKCGDRVIPEPKSEEDSNGNDNGNTDIDNGNGESEEDGNGGTCNCNPGEAPALCAAEGSNGVLVAHEKCNKYYVCVNGESVQRSCPSGLLYNPWKEVCDWPNNVQCGDRVVPEPKSKEDSNENENGNTDIDNGNGNNNTEESVNGSAESELENTGNCDPNQAQVLCATENSEGVLVAHESCNKFYICSKGEPVALSCPPKLLFNPASHQCDWPANVQCGERIIPDSESESTEEESYTDKERSCEESNDSSSNSSNENDNTEDNQNTGNCDPSQAPAICDAKGSDGILVAHENCNQFYMCSKRIPVTLTCPPNLLFNPAIAQCDWADNVQCGNRTIPEDCEEEYNETDTDGGEDNETSNTGNSDPSQAPKICSEEGSDGILVAHEVCCKFYVCSKGEPLARDCPVNLFYNPSIEQCDWPQNVNCGDRILSLKNISLNKHLKMRRLYTN